MRKIIINEGVHEELDPITLRPTGAIVSIEEMVPSPKWLSGVMKAGDLTEDEALVILANKDLPTSTKYEIVDVDTLPDGYFRDAWEYVTGGVTEKTSNDLSDSEKSIIGMGPLEEDTPPD